jgi:hypothetical protein
MKSFYLSLLFIGTFLAVQAQENILVTNPEVDQIMTGDYDPSAYLPSTIINHPDDIFDGIIAGISTDSLLSYLEILSTFENRNTGADTTSNTFGMGAARRWAFDMFTLFSTQHENRLKPAYLQFDQDICGMGQHRNVIAALPGIGANRHELIIVEAHMDSRCEDNCDIECVAHGMEDNGSGTALVLELARVMSQFAFDRTIIFMITTGEEQGLFGANAFAEYCQNEELEVYAVYNNDIVGGVICGETASPPGCPGLNEVDSINVRLYSASGSLASSSSRRLARFARLEYEENIAPLSIHTNHDQYYGTGRPLGKRRRPYAHSDKEAIQP